MESWFQAAVLSLLLYGLWGFFPKLAVQYISPQSALVYEVAGGLLVGVWGLQLTGFRPDLHPVGILFAALTGVTGMLGTLFYFRAAQQGQISVLVAMTALYPLVTITLAALFLQEPLTGRQVAGLLCALLALVLLAF